METIQSREELTPRRVFTSLREARAHGGRPISELVHETLRSAILNAELLPGEAIPENEFAGLLGVSRTPLREAIKKLQIEGLASVIPQVGTFVSRIDLGRVKEALFMREAVECAAISRLPGALSKEDAHRLMAIVDQHARTARASQLSATMQSDDEFHRFLLELAGVPGVWRYVVEARETHRRVRVLSQVQTQFDAARRAAKQHKAIASAIVAGRREEASELLREHIRTTVVLSENAAKLNPQYFVNI